MKATEAATPAQREPFIPGSRLKVLYLTFYLALFGISARMVVVYFVSTPESLLGEVETYRWPAIGLLLVFGLLAMARHAFQFRVGRLTHQYLALQSALVFALLLLPPHIDLYAILFFLLSMEAMLSLPRHQGYAWIAFFSVLGTAGVILDHGLVGGLAQSFIFVAGYFFFGSFASAMAEADLARHEAHRLLEELQERDAALQQSEERYRRVVEGCPDAILVFDARGRVVDCNPSACILFGQSADELLASSLRELVGEEEYERQAMSLLDDETREPRTHFDELSLALHDGRQIHLEGEIGVISLRGEPHLLAMARDVTQRKVAQEALFRQTKDLAVLEERNRMAREIHDTLAQGFTGIVVQLEAAEQLLTEGAAGAERHLTVAKTQARESLQEARRSVWNLLPRALENGSVEAALRDEVARFNSGGREIATFVVNGEPLKLPGSIQTGLLRVCQESLTNVRRHAGATLVEIELEFTPEFVGLTIRDDGAGFDGSDSLADTGFGLRGMSARAQALGGSFSVHSAKGKGTEIAVRLPVQESKTVESLPS